uniref:Uncharacterized protein n=1 Tax=Arundo donax TaxID=35708 RepID=A0A0A9CMW2_ARUDO
MAGRSAVARKGSTGAQKSKTPCAPPPFPPAAPPPPPAATPLAPPAPTPAAMDYNADADASMEDACYVFDKMVLSGQSFTNLMNGSVGMDDIPFSIPLDDVTMLMKKLTLHLLQRRNGQGRAITQLRRMRLWLWHGRWPMRSTRWQLRVMDEEVLAKKMEREYKIMFIDINVLDETQRACVETMRGKSWCQRWAGVGVHDLPCWDEQCFPYV